MATIQSLIEIIRRNKEQIRTEICHNNGKILSELLNTAHDYVLAPDLSPNTWNNLSEEEKEFFYYFFLANEINHFQNSPKILLTNASIYLPKQTNINARLKLFSKLSKMNHVQNQFERFALEYLIYANAICKIDDPYIDKLSIKQLLLNYFYTFVQTAKESLLSLGQLSLLENTLPIFVQHFKENPFAMESVGELIEIAKGNGERPIVTITFVPPFLKAS